MIFLELVLQNFGPYAGKQIINLNPRHQEELRPIILLGGMNGGGKTTLMDAIRLALYGHRAECSTRGNLSYSDFLTQCVNSQANPTDKTRIELAFEHIEDDKPVQYRIVRTWEKNPKDGKDILGILENDDWPEVALANIWDEYIENLLPVGISNLFLFDGEQVKELAEQEAPPPIVADAIRGLLGLELAERLAVDIDILVNRKRKAIADTKDLVNLEELEQKLRQQQGEYETETGKFESLQAELINAENDQQETFDKFISEGGKIAGESTQLKERYQAKTEEVEASRQAMCTLAADILPLGLIEPLLAEAKVQAEMELQQQKAQIARDILIQRDERLLQLISQLEMAAENVDKIQEFIQKENQILVPESDTGANAWLLADAETITQLSYLLDYHLETAKVNAQQYLGIVRTRGEEIVTLERQLQTAASPEVYQRLVDAVKTAQNQVGKIKAKCESLKRRLGELDLVIKQTKKELQEYSKNNIDRRNDEHILAASAKVQETLKIFREKLTLRKLNKLEMEVTECFRYLLHKSDLVHRVAIDTHSFALSLYDLQGKPVPKHRLSAGEKQLLAIAFLWGLARISGRRLPVAIDTPLGRLDSSHRANLVERYFPAASNQVILLSTDTEIGKAEYENLKQNDAIAREYLLKYNPQTRQTTVVDGYFWSKTNDQ